MRKRLFLTIIVAFMLLGCGKQEEVVKATDEVVEDVQFVEEKEESRELTPIELLTKTTNIYYILDKLGDFRINIASDNNQICYVGKDYFYWEDMYGNAHGVLNGESFEISQVFDETHKSAILNIGSASMWEFFTTGIYRMVEEGEEVNISSIETLGSKMKITVKFPNEMLTYSYLVNVQDEVLESICASMDDMIYYGLTFENVEDKIPYVLSDVHSEIYGGEDTYTITIHKEGSKVPYNFTVNKGINVTFEVEGDYESYPYIDENYTNSVDILSPLNEDTTLYFKRY